MSKKMSVMGVAGKIAVVLVVSFAVTASLSTLYKSAFRISDSPRALATMGVAMAVIGFTLNLIAGLSVLSAHKKGTLVTSGLYSLFLHPMYTIQILITIPGLLLLLNSWLVMLTLVPVWISFRVFVKEEDKYLEEKFGTEYREYRRRVLFKFL